MVPLRGLLRQLDNVVQKLVNGGNDTGTRLESTL
jgi:hypothetical protein